MNHTGISTFETQAQFLIAGFILVDFGVIGELGSVAAQDSPECIRADAKPHEPGFRGL